MSEAFCQNALYRWAHDAGHRYIAPNVKMFAWEGDLASVSRHGYLVEYEIKCSRSDFLADKKKLRHRWLLQGIDKVDLGALKLKVPSYFYYALKEGVRYEPDEIPAYAGVLRIYSPLVFIEKEAPQIHARKASDQERQWLTNAVVRRYWRERLREKK